MITDEESTHLLVGALAKNHTVGLTDVVVLLLVGMWLDSHIVPGAPIVL